MIFFLHTEGDIRLGKPAEKGIHHGRGVSILAHAPGDVNLPKTRLSDSAVKPRRSGRGYTALTAKAVMILDLM